MNEKELYVKLLNYVRGWLEGSGYHQALEALNLCKQVSVGVRRDGVTPNFSHQLHIVRFSISLAPLLIHAQRVMTLGFLHDVIEDGLMDKSFIEEKFGEEIAKSVVLLSKIRDNSKIFDDEYYADLLEDPHCCLVKGIDRLHNLETMAGAFTPEKKVIYLKETEQYVLPMLKATRNNHPEFIEAIDIIRHIMKINVRLIKGESI